MPKKDSITIPLHLAKLLAAEDEDFKQGENIDDIRKTARALLKLLMSPN